MTIHRRAGLFARLVLCTVLVAGAATSRAAAQGSIPDRLTDQEFWKMVTSMSEPGGTFRSDNLLSNETGFLYPIPELQRTIKPGNVYMGVGPEQNFTYIAALHPKMVFIVDIRRGAMLQHLIYKALFEMYDNRADFLAHLFSRPRPAGLDTSSSADALFAAFDAIPTDSAYYYRTFAAIKNHLTKDHGFTLTPDDTLGMVGILDAFYRGGPRINYSYCAGPCSGNGNRIGGGMPDYFALMTTTDAAGVKRSYLANETNYRYLRDLEMRNMFVPLVGDFAGPKAIRAVGTYVREHNGVVTAMYVSNVEQYLFQDGIARNYYDNIATVPTDSTTMFIRSGGGGGNCPGGYGGGGGFGGAGGMRASVIGSVQVLLKAVGEGKVQCYGDVFAYTH